MAFAKPATGDNFNNADNNGRLLLITPLETKLGIVTSASQEPVDVIVADVVVLDGDDVGKVYTGTYLFGRVLFNALKSAIGKDDPVLGRLGKGPKQPGEHPAWTLTEFTDADVKTAEAYLASQAPAAPKASAQLDPPF